MIDILKKANKDEIKTESNETESSEEPKTEDTKNLIVQLREENEQLKKKNKKLKQEFINTIENAKSNYKTIDDKVSALLNKQGYLNFRGIYPLTETYDKVKKQFNELSKAYRAVCDENFALKKGNDYDIYATIYSGELHLSETDQKDIETKSAKIKELRKKGYDYNRDITNQIEELENDLDDFIVRKSRDSIYLSNEQLIKDYNEIYLDVMRGCPYSDDCFDDTHYFINDEDY